MTQTLTRDFFLISFLTYGVSRYTLQNLETRLGAVIDPEWARKSLFRIDLPRLEFGKIRNPAGPTELDFTFRHRSRGLRNPELNYITLRPRSN